MKNRVILKHRVQTCRTDKNHWEGNDREAKHVGRRKPRGFFAKVICLLFIPFPFAHDEPLSLKTFLSTEIFI